MAVLAEGIYIVVKRWQRSGEKKIGNYLGCLIVGLSHHGKIRRPQVTRHGYSYATWVVVYPGQPDYSVFGERAPMPVLIFGLAKGIFESCS